MYNRRKRNLRQRWKSIAIVAVPVVILVSITYASIASLTKASKSTYAFEKSSKDSAYSGDGEEYDTINQSGDDDLGDDEEIEVITNHDNMVPDTKPGSITVLVNKELPLPSDYIPDDLVVPNVSFSFSYYDEKKLMRKVAADALEQLFNAAKANNIYLNGVSAYRSYERQYEIFTNNIKKQGLEHTMKYSATPGYSEHQTGLAIDVSADSVNNRLDESFGETVEGKWLAEHAHEYGFIIRYPKDKSAITGYSYEPWHIRYVGKALAKYIYENNLCLEEYFNFKPSMDYSDQISYDSLQDYGIDLADVLEPTKAPAATPTVTPTTKPEEDTKDETKTEDEDDNTKDDGSGKKSKGKQVENTADSKKENDKTGNTKEKKKDNNTEDKSNHKKEEATVTPTPSSDEKDSEITPTPSLTPTPTPDEETTPDPSQTPASSEP
ncbi:MAG: hypothetical protein ACFWTJ_09815 [Lachnoclostridium sp.]|jgi:zinc D-Ala-D-Ala carboxypeptidase